MQDPLLRPAGAPDVAMVRDVERATSLRMAAWQHHVSLAGLSRFQRVEQADWARVATDAQVLMDARLPASTPAAQALAARLQALIALSVGNDVQLVQTMTQALVAEPLLRAGAMLPMPVKHLIEAAAASALKPSR